MIEQARKFAADFEKEIEKWEKIVVVGHYNPDGDSVGSVTGMVKFLESQGKKPVAVFPNEYPKFLSFLDPDKEYMIYFNQREAVKQIIDEAELIICLDFNKMSRTEWLGDILSANKSARKILIDHHPQPQVECFDLVCSVVDLSSTCELLFYILMNTAKVRNSVENLPYSSLLGLATGMLTDTNNFKNSTGAGTFFMASKLTEKGINLNDLGERVFGSYSQERMRLMGHMLKEEMVVLKDLGAAYMILTKELQNQFKYMQGDSEGFVNLPLLIDGIETTAFFTETDEFVRVSLRSKGGISVNNLSQKYFNGGGHERAAGGRLYIPVGEIGEYYRSSLDKFLKKGK